MGIPPQTLGWIPTPGYARGQRWELWRLGVTGRRTYVGRVWHNPYGVVEAFVSAPSFKNLRGPHADVRSAAVAIETEWVEYLRRARLVRRAWQKARKAERREKR